MKRLLMLAILMLSLLLAAIAFAADPAPAASALPAVIEQYKGYVIIGLSVAWGISEALAIIPGVKANGLFHGFYLALGKILGKEVS